MNDLSIQTPRLPGLRRFWSSTDIARKSFLQVVSRLQTGSVTVYEGNNTYRFGNADAVVFHADQTFAAFGNCNVDLPSACVDRVFHQLFNRRCWTLHHFASSDPIDRSFVQLTNWSTILAYVGVGGMHSTRDSRGTAPRPRQKE